MPQQLITQCPACKTRFDVSRAQLSAAAGQVRCSHCQHIFVATEHLENRAATPPMPATRRAIRTATITAKRSVTRSAIPREPVRLSGRSRATGPARLVWSLLILVALSGAGAQVLWFERDQLSQQILLIPAYAYACQVIDCRLPPRQDLLSIHSQQLLIRKHPDYLNAVTLDLLLINQAPFDQPFPALRLSFSGLDNSLRAARTFQPQEYIGGDFSPGELMPSNRQIQIHLELLDPGTLAPSYQLQLQPANRGF
ncbi:MAG: putative Zn finger-like uncharacterized protein [Motiliproteus sp.]|jgi:predicted Zn finger-like uncharacterized protein